MSNMAGVTKDQFPEGTTASLEGFTGPNGEMLLGVDFTQEEVDGWNGVKTKPAPVVKVAAAPKAKPAKKKSTKAKKKTVWKTMKSAFE